MTKTPLVSIICTVYNKAPWLERVIKSFLAQEVDFPIEILLIDDASTDGSAAIIECYAKDYPTLIRAYYNEENLGISKTWIKICQEAKGDYIARCDGDDFWLDSKKLAKQVALLKSNPKARWSNTDFDIYNEEGQFVSASGFENGSIPLADTFEKMLATRGFTMASTWLVERELMLEVNQELDLTTADDTFNLQMDLFQRTELAYLPEATVAYTINQGSDSRPKDFQKIEKRFNTLLKVQKTYLDKYPNSNHLEMLRILLDRNNQYELELTRQAAGLEQVFLDKVTVYFDRFGIGFTEEDAIHFPILKEDSLQLELPKDCQRIRIDMSEQSSFYLFIRLLNEQGSELMPQFHNGIHIGDFYFFPNPDPQIVYELPKGIYGQKLTLVYQMCELDNLHSDNYVGKVLARELLDTRYRLATEVRTSVGFLQEKLALADQVQKQQAKLEEVTRLYHSVISSRRWIIPTKIINFFRRKS